MTAQLPKAPAVHVPCATYTKFEFSFGLHQEQQAAISSWMEAHDREKHAKQFRCGVRYSGCIGGAYSYKFTPTSLGVVTTVQCSCGDAIDVSDYDQW